MAEAPPPTMPQPGDLLAGKYRVERMLGSGGMGCVLAAEHTVLRTRVALKLLLPQAAAVPGATERFLREARAVGALRSEHVAQVIDVGSTETGAPFLVMEHLTGQDLRKLARERGALPVGEVIEYLSQIGDAVREAHEKSIIHRDLKPGNVFVTTRKDGAPLLKVLDFGLAKVLDPIRAEASEDSITQTDLVVGSPHYMSPEQFKSLRNADVRSDIWALGVIAYELLAGRRPFFGEGMSGVMLSVVTEQPDPLLEMRPELPPRLVALVMRCLEKPPARRPQSVAEILAELQAIRLALGASDERSNSPSAQSRSGSITDASGASISGVSGESGPAAVAMTAAAPPRGMPGVLPPAPGRSTWRMVDLAKDPATHAASAGSDTHKGVSVSPEEAWAEAAHVRGYARRRASRRRWMLGGAALATVIGGVAALLLTTGNPQAGAGAPSATPESAGQAPGQGTSATVTPAPSPSAEPASPSGELPPSAAVSAAPPAAAPAGASASARQPVSQTTAAPLPPGSKPAGARPAPAPGAKKSSAADPFGKYD